MNKKLHSFIVVLTLGQSALQAAQGYNYENSWFRKIGKLMSNLLPNAPRFKVRHSHNLKIMQHTEEETKKETQLFEAIRAHNIYAVQQVLEEGIIINVPLGYYDETPLHLAVENFNPIEPYNVIDMVNLLLRYGADINSQNKYGITPLHLATCRGNTALVELLLNQGANPNAQTKEGQTPLHWVTRGTIFSEDSINNYTAIINLLLNYNANPNAQDHYNRTPLHLAISGRYWMVERLLENRADINAQDINGCTPLHNAINDVSIDNAIKLVLNGANAHIQDNEGRNSFVYALYKKPMSTPLIKILIQTFINSPYTVQTVKENFNITEIIDYDEFLQGICQELND